MPSRNELAVRAAAVGFDASTISNDSKLEQKVLYLEKRQAAISGTAPTTTLTSTGTAGNNETVTVGNRTYTFKTALTGAANEVLIGADAAASIQNLKDAINRTGTPGTQYSAATVRHPDVTAGASDATTVVIASTDSNANSAFTTTETMTNFAFTGATASAGTLGSKAVGTSTTGGAPGISGDRNVTL
jgi:hypothetical protein